MRLRLGLLRDVGSIDRQIQKEAAEAQAKKNKPDGKSTEAGSSSKDEAGSEKAKGVIKPRIRPLSEAKAIDSGANFISEAFLFLVAGGLIVFESLRARRKESSRREDVADRLARLEETQKAALGVLTALEKELLAVESGQKPLPVKRPARIIPKELRDPGEEEEDEKNLDSSKGSWAWLRRFMPWTGSSERETSTSSSSSFSSSPERLSPTPSPLSNDSRIKPFPEDPPKSPNGNPHVRHDESGDH